MMTVDNAQSLSIEEAIDQTLSPEGKCSVCVAIEAGRKQESETPPALPGFGDKAFLVFINAGKAQLPAVSVAETYIRPERFAGFLLRIDPLTPPPRVD